jgi:uncharacterized membrane protein HdeD (DUF308 family)
MTVSQPGPGRMRKMLLGGAWWLMLLRGIVALLVGLFVVVQPRDALTLTAQILGAYAIFDGIGASVAAFRGRGGGSRVWVLARGALSIIFGILVLTLPGLFVRVAGAIWLTLIAVQSILAGALDVFTVARARKEFERPWSVTAGGLLLILLGALIIAAPRLFGEAIVLYIGLSIIALGLLLIGLALLLRFMGRRLA